MQIVRLITARGQGVWGRQTYDIELAETSRTRWDSAGYRRHTSRSFELLVDDPPVGRRTFVTDADRTQFVNRSLTELMIEPLNPPEETSCSYPPAGEVGQKLMGVDFGRDYLSLNFQGGLSLFVWPRIHRSDEVLEHGRPGYTDALLGLIDQTVADVDELLDFGLVIEFENGTSLVVPLDGADSGTSGDIGEYGVRNEDGGRDEWGWNVGDDDVEWLTSSL